MRRCRPASALLIATAMLLCRIGSAYELKVVNTSGHRLSHYPVRLQVERLPGGGSGAPACR